MKIIRLQLAFVFPIIFALSSLSIAQSSQHKEVKDDPYLSTSKKLHKKGPAFRYLDDNVTIVQVNVDESGQNILGDAANEPSIAVDVTNPNRMVIGWRQFDNVMSNFRQAGYAYTSDGGMTWNFSGVIEPGVFRSDPVLDSDSEGNFYYNSLTVENNNDYVCDVFKSTDGGMSWSIGVDAQGGDKQWMVIDKTSNYSNGHIYAYWNAAFSTCGNNSFTRSIDNGNTFEECVHIPSEPYWGTLVVAKNGDLFLCGFDGRDFVVVKSTNAKYPDSTVSFYNPVAVNMNGDLPGFGGPNPAGITGQIYIATDTSNNQFGDYVYLLATVSNETNGDPADIYVAASPDGGETWLDPVRVNQDSSESAWQWFGTLSVAPNGRIDVAWLDTRNSPEGDFISELFYSFSVDGGQTWYEEVNLLPESFDPHVGWPNQNKMGDYFHMVSDNEGVHLAMSGTYHNEQDVYYVRIFTDIINDVSESKRDLPLDFNLKQNYPNPFNPLTIIEYNIARESKVALKIFDILGEEVVVLVDELKNSGSYKVSFDASKLTSGVYFYTLQADQYLQTRKMILLK